MPRMPENEFMRRVVSMPGYTPEDAKRLWEVAKQCIGPAMVVGGTTGMVLSVSSGTVTLGTTAVPGWAIGFLGGFISGEILCIAGWGNIRKAFDEILRPIRPSGR